MVEGADGGTFRNERRRHPPPPSAALPPCEVDHAPGMILNGRGPFILTRPGGEGL